MSQYHKSHRCSAKLRLPNLSATGILLAWSNPSQSQWRRLMVVHDNILVRINTNPSPSCQVMTMCQTDNRRWCTACNLFKVQSMFSAQISVLQSKYRRNTSKERGRMKEKKLYCSKTVVTWPQNSALQYWTAVSVCLWHLGASRMSRSLHNTEQRAR